MWEKIKRKFATILDVQEKEFLPAILEVTETPPSPAGRIVQWSLFVLVIVALGWAFLGHVDEVAIATGKIYPVGNVKMVQAEDKGVITAIYCKDGDWVKAGQVLLEMDPTFTEADLASTKIQVAQLQLEIDRLLAEQSGQPFMPAVRDGLTEKDIEFERYAYISRTNDYRTRMETAQRTVQQNAAAVQSATAVLNKYEALLPVSRDKERRLEELVAQNAVSLFTLFDQRSQRMEMEHNVDAQSNEVQKAQATLAQSRDMLRGVETTYQMEIATKLTEARQKLVVSSETLKKAERKQALSRVVAPIDGRINQLAVHTVGGVVTAAQPLMTVVPEDAVLEMEGFVLNKDIGFVHEGQDVEVKVDSFNFQKYGTLKGTVTQVSSDTVENNDKENKDKGPVYRVVVHLAENSVGNLTSGMTATAEIKIREKRIIEFFLDPFKKYQHEALRER